MLCSRVSAATCSSGVHVTTELQRSPVIGVTSAGDTHAPCGKAPPAFIIQNYQNCYLEQPGWLRSRVLLGTDGFHGETFGTMLKSCCLCGNVLTQEMEIRTSWSSCLTQVDQFGSEQRKAVRSARMTRSFNSISLSLQAFSKRNSLRMDDLCVKFRR